MRPDLQHCLAIAALAALVLVSPDVAASATKSPHQTFQDECGACHWAYQPDLLPARSWKKITSDLTHHFGQNASLDKKTTATITRYLVQHAADASGANHAFMRGLGPNDTPKRITDTPLWRGIHRGLSSWDFSDPRVKTKSNCMGCHGRQ